MMPYDTPIHDHFCRCRACKPPRLPDGRLRDAIGQQVSPVDPRSEMARDRAAMGAAGLVAVLALCLRWAGLA
jgi:hypothetical protein